jgi:hypothetical protein
MAEISKAGLKVVNNQNFPDNNTGFITPSKLREFNTDLIDSTVNQATYSADISAIQSDISALEAFTSSQQPSFTALNSFTASQSVINAGYNSFTQSANASIASVVSEVDSIQTWTASVNEIRTNNVFQGYATRFNFGGFLSASLVQNVNGPIADINYLQDPTKLNTSSFDAYVTSTNAFTASAKVSFTNINAFTASNSNASLNAYTASQNVINASVTASLTELLNLSSSLSGGYATQGELDASASALQNNIDTKLDTASFEAYTASFSQSVETSFSQSYAFINDFSQSTDISISSSIGNLSASVASIDDAQTLRIDGLASFTGSYATTGSNTFVQPQVISGSITITGSAYGNVFSASIVSNTASIDLSVANYFTLRLAANENTNINVINPQPGVTATLLINTDATSSVSWSANIKQPSASVYIPSISGNVDAISLTAFDTESVYAIPAYAFV